MKEQKSFLETFTAAEKHAAMSDEELIATGAAMVGPVLRWAAKSATDLLLWKFAEPPSLAAEVIRLEENEQHRLFS